MDLPEFNVPSVDIPIPTLPNVPDIPSVSLPSITLPKFELPKLPELPKIPKIDFPTLADGAFSGGAKEEFATADIYKLAGGAGKSITSIQELSQLPNTSLFDKLDGSATADFLAKAKGGLKFDENLLTNRLLGTQNEFKAQFGELTGAMKKGALLDTFKDKAKYVLTTIKDTKSLVKAAKIGDVKALGNFVNKYTGGKSFSGTDKGAVGGLLGSVVSTASNLGVSGVFTTLAETVNDKGIIGRVTRAVLPFALKNSDSKLLKELTAGTAGKLINVISPGFTQSFSKAFKKPQGGGNTTLSTFNDVFGAFKGIDKNWDKLTRGNDGNIALNLMSLMGGSKDFRNLITSGIRYYSTEKAAGRPTPVPIDPLHALASSYSEVTVGRAIARDFPKVALLSLYNEKLPRTTGTVSGTRNSKNGNVVDASLVNNALINLFGK